MRTKVKNLTSERLGLRVSDLLNRGREYIIYIGSNSQIDLEDLMLLDRDSLKGKVEINGVCLGEAAPSTVPSAEESKTEDVVVSQEEIVEECLEDISKEKSSETTLDSKYVCEVCGAEFASARGLSSHVNRVHHKE